MISTYSLNFLLLLSNLSVELLFEEKYGTCLNFDHSTEFIGSAVCYILTWYYWVYAQYKRSPPVQIEYFTGTALNGMCMMFTVIAKYSRPKILF
jgi:hypothetical protein